MATPILDEIRFLVDENLLRLGRALSHLRRDIALVGNGVLSDLIPFGTADSTWIPLVGDRGWVIVTNDQRVRTRPVEAHLAVLHRLKVVHLHGQVGNAAPWSQAARLFARWDSIEAYTTAHPDGPWWLSARRDRLQPMRFEPGATERVR